MAMRISGISSGLDTDSMVQELVKVSSKKKEDLEKAQKKLEWKQETWKGLNSKVYSFFNDQLSNLNLEGSFIKKKTTVADSSIASVIAGDTAINGTQTLAVKRLAKEGYLTGGKLSSDKSVKGSTNLSKLTGDKIGATDTFSLRVKVGGKEKTIELKGTSTIDDVLKSLSDAGVTARFDETNQRIFINAGKTGKDNDFTLLAGDEKGAEALVGLGLLTSSDLSDPENAAYQEYSFWAQAYDAGAGAIDQAKFDELVKEKTKEKAASMLKNMDSLISRVQELREQRNKLTDPNELENNKNLADPVVRELAEMANVLNDFYKRSVDDLNAQMMAQKDIINDTSGTYTPDQVADAQAKLAELTKASDEAKANWQKATQGYAVASSAAGSMGINIPASDAPVTKLEDTVAKDSENMVKASAAALGKKDTLASTPSGSAVRVLGSDAVIMLNGAEFTSENNGFSINGLTITANAVSAVTGQDADGNDIYAETTISTTDDVDGIYDMVKNFIKQYNDLIKEMDKLYNADTAKGYEPLTDEEKDALSDTEVEKWETKIKDSLLRRDGDLGTLINTFKTSMLNSYTINGKQYSLSSFGINTMNYFKAAENEKGVFHIDGDADDSTVSGNVNELKAAIASDPEGVTKFFTQLVGDFKDKVNDLMQRTDYRSMYKVYDDKRMQSEYDDYKSKIKTQEKKLQSLEDRYYKQFTAMEKAMSKLNSQQSYLSSLFGG